MTSSTTTDHDDLREQVRSRYADAARAVLTGDPTPSDAAASCCAPHGSIAFGDALYGADERRMVMVPCGFDPAEFSPMDRSRARLELGLDPGEFVVLQLGRMVPPMA